MAKLTLIESPGTGVEIPDPSTNPPRNPGDQILIIDRRLVDKQGNLRGSFTFRGVITKRFTANDLEVAFDATNKLDKGVINAQGVVRFTDFASANGVTWAIVGGTGKYKKARGTVTGKFVAPDTLFTFRVR
jgi:hypothetical protein